MNAINCLDCRKQFCCVLQAFSCTERFCEASKFKCLISKGYYQKDIDKLKDHSSVSDHKANGIPSKDKSSKSLRSHFGQDMTRLDNKVLPSEGCKHQEREKI